MEIIVVDINLNYCYHFRDDVIIIFQTYLGTFMVLADLNELVSLVINVFRLAF